MKTAYYIYYCSPQRNGMFFGGGWSRFVLSDEVQVGDFIDLGDDVKFRVERVYSKSLMYTGDPPVAHLDLSYCG